MLGLAGQYTITCSPLSALSTCVRTTRALGSAALRDQTQRPRYDDPASHTFPFPAHSIEAPGTAVPLCCPQTPPSHPRELAHRRVGPPFASFPGRLVRPLHLDSAAAAA